MKEIEYYKHINGKVPVIEWLKGIDTTFRGRINGRLTRIVENGNFGDFKQLDDNISELILGQVIEFIFLKLATL